MVDVQMVELEPTRLHRRRRRLDLGSHSCGKLTEPSTTCMEVIP